MKNNIVREVVSSQYLPGKSKLDNPLRPVLHQRLLDWESNLPTEMQFQPSMAREVMFLVGMLHMAYAYVITPPIVIRFGSSTNIVSNLYVLLYRPIFLQPPSQLTSSEGNIALEAATKSTRILEDMLSQNLVQHGSVHLLASLSPKYPLWRCPSNNAIELLTRFLLCAFTLFTSDVSPVPQKSLPSIVRSSVYSD